MTDGNRGRRMGFLSGNGLGQATGSGNGKGEGEQAPPGSFPCSRPGKSGVSVEAEWLYGRLRPLFVGKKSNLAGE